MERPREENDPFIVAIHGGAGVISKSIDGQPYVVALRRILKDVYDHFTSLQLQLKTFNAVDIVEYATVLLEEEPLFNAGKGSVLCSDGTHELEASVMNGSTLECGAVSLLKCIRNPVRAARLVMHTTPHVYMVGTAAERLATEAGLEQVENSFFNTERRRNQLREAQNRGQSSFLVFRDHDLSRENVNQKEEAVNEEGKGTVGCVAMYQGGVAAATSTGGMTNKFPGRVGDTPIIGSGTYANDATCAVSATGTGEEFMRHLAAHDISARMEHGGKTLQQACQETVFHKLPDQSGGVIAIDSKGQVILEFNCGGMFRGHFNSLQPRNGNVGIWESMDEVDLVQDS